MTNQKYLQQYRKGSSSSRSMTKGKYTSLETYFLVSGQLRPIARQNVETGAASGHRYLIRQFFPVSLKNALKL